MSEKRLFLSPWVRSQIKNKYGGKCGYCGQEPEKLQIDHIHPVCNSRRLPMYKDQADPDNLMPACFSCNNYKHGMSLEEFRGELGRQVERARRDSVNFRNAEKFGLVQVVEKPIVFYFESLTQNETVGTYEKAKMSIWIS